MPQTYLDIFLKCYIAAHKIFGVNLQTFTSHIVIIGHKIWKTLYLHHARIVGSKKLGTNKFSVHKCSLLLLWQ